MKIEAMDLNAFLQLTDKSRLLVVQFIHDKKTELQVGDELENINLLMALEWVLQGLGAEGYGFS